MKPVRLFLPSLPSAVPGTLTLTNDRIFFWQSTTPYALYDVCKYIFVCEKTFD